MSHQVKVMFPVFLWSLTLLLFHIPFLSLCVSCHCEWLPRPDVLHLCPVIPLPCVYRVLPISPKLFPPFPLVSFIATSPAHCKI